MSSYSNARAVKKKTKKSKTTINESQAKKVANKIKKSPVLIIILFALVIGAVAGFFSFTYLSEFSMQSYSVNGEICQELDYIEIDITKYKEQLETQGIQKSVEEIYESYKLVDGGYVCKFFGSDISNTVSVKYYYREDISYDAKEIDGIDIRTAGVYYIEYTSSHFAFKNTKLIRTIIVMEVESNG